MDAGTEVKHSYLRLPHAGVVEAVHVVCWCSHMTSIPQSRPWSVVLYGTDSESIP